MASKWPEGTIEPTEPFEKASHHQCRPERLTQGRQEDVLPIVNSSQTMPNHLADQLQEKTDLQGQNTAKVERWLTHATQTAKNRLDDHRRYGYGEQGGARILDLIAW